MSNAKKHVAALATVALLTLLLGSTSAFSAPTAQASLPAEVLRSDWLLQYLSGDDEAAGKDMSSSAITIKFAADGTLSGFGGCNQYSGSYTVSGQQMTIAQNLISTMMACPEDVMATEQLYFRHLLSVNAWALTQGKLDLIYADGATAMTYVPAAQQGGQAGASSLPNEVLQTEWVLRYFDSTASAPEDVAVAGITIKFAADNTLAGFAGCNQYSGRYRVSGEQLTIGENLSTTRMACPAAPTTLEGRYLGLLPTVKSYTASATELKLTYGDDGAALVYIPRSSAPQVEPAAPAPAPAPAPQPEPAAPTPPVEVGMPATGEGSTTPLLLALGASLLAMGAGVTVRKVFAGREVR